MKSLLAEYKKYAVYKKKAKKSKKFWFKRHKRKLFSFYKEVSTSEFSQFVEDSLIFKMAKLSRRNFKFNNRFNLSFFFRNFYGRNPRQNFIENYFSRLNYMRFKTFKNLKGDTLLDFFDNNANLYDFSDFFYSSFKKKIFYSKKRMNRAFFSNFFFESGKLENIYIFFFANLKNKEKNLFNFLNLNSQFCFFENIKFSKSFGFFFREFFFQKSTPRFLRSFFFSFRPSTFLIFRNFWSFNKFFGFFKKTFLLKSFLFSLDKFKKNFSFGFYNNYKWNLSFHFFKNFYNQRNLKPYFFKKR